jgi:hypothetical protein
VGIRLCRHDSAADLATQEQYSEFAVR